MKEVRLNSSTPGHRFLDRDGIPIAVKTVSVLIGAAGTNQTVISAVTSPTNKKLVILGGVVREGNAVAGSIWFKNGSGGASLLNIGTPVGEQTILELSEIGWMETSSGVGLYADTGAGQVVVSLRYVEFTEPST